MMRSLLPLILAGLLTGCASLSSNVGDTERESSEERIERQRAALYEISARNQAQRDEEAETGPQTAMPDLPVQVVRPESYALTDEGQLRRSGVEAFIEAGPHGVLGAAQLLPARNESGIIGFQITQISERGRWLRDAGIEEGDIIRSVNGESIVMPDDFLAVFDSVADSDAIVVEIVRAGQDLQLVFPIIDEVASTSPR